MVTYEEILNRMLSEYSKLSGFELSMASDVYIRMCVLAGELYNCWVNTEWLRRQTFVSTATGEYLDFHAAQRGIERREASASLGIVRFNIEMGALIDIVIPKGTIVSTTGEEPLCFATTETVTLKQGKYSVSAPVRAISTGSRYNVVPGKISVIVTALQGNMTVINSEACESGTDKESDESLRKRIVDSYKNTSNGTNCAYYEKVATEIPGVTSASAVPKGRGAGTVDVYVASSGSEIADDTLAQVQNTLSRLREVNVDVLIKRAEPAVVNLNLKLSVSDGYEFEQVKEACVEALRNYINTRGVGGKMLLTEAGERVIHIDGVSEYSFDSYSNSDIRCAKTHYPVTGTITVTQGVLL